MDIKVCRYKWIFWLMNKYQDISISENKFSYEGREYELKKAHKAFFIILKYALPMVFVFFIFNRYDFEISLSRGIEFLLAGLGLLLVKRRIYLLVLFVLTIITSIFVQNISLIPFTIKYFFALILFKTLIIDIRYTKVFKIIKDKKILSYLTYEERK